MNLQAFTSIELIIPLWQLGLYAVLISFFMLFSRDKHGISISLGLIFYWVFIYNQPRLKELFGTSPAFMVNYLVCATLLVFLILISFFVNE